MARFNPETYDSVESRLQKFWDTYSDGRILTRLLSDPNALDEVVVQAEVYATADDTRPTATGLAFEKRGTSFNDGANLTSHLENCETSAIGRAFANWVFKAKKDSPRASREEMRKVNQASEQHNRAPSPQPARTLTPEEQERKDATDKRAGILSMNDWMNKNGLDHGNQELARYITSVILDRQIISRKELTPSDWGKVNNTLKGWTQVNVDSIMTTFNSRNYEPGGEG